jgi:hypothetical protein
MVARLAVWNPEEVATHGDEVPLGQPAMVQQEILAPEAGSIFTQALFHG